MEHPNFRDNLERLNTMYPDKELLNKGEIAKFLGVSYNYLRQQGLFKVGTPLIPKVTVAKFLCQ